MANFSVACLPPVFTRAMLLTFLLLVAAATFIIVVVVVVVVVVAAAFYVSFSRMRRRLTRFQRTSA